MFEGITYYLNGGKYPQGSLLTQLRKYFSENKPIHGFTQAKAVTFSNGDWYPEYSNVYGYVTKNWSDNSYRYKDDACQVFKDFVHEHNERSGYQSLLFKTTGLHEGQESCQIIRNYTKW